MYAHGIIGEKKDLKYTIKNMKSKVLEGPI
jgi:hypothetical protein